MIKLPQKPDFVIAGSGKSGTTSLYSYLSQHPEICLSQINFPIIGSKYHVKEINFFNRHFEKGQDFYKKFFENCGPNYVMGEASQNYFISSKAPRRMYEYNPDFRLIFILRDPASRTYSEYKFHVQTRGWKISFDELLKKLDNYGTKDKSKNEIFEDFIEKSLYYKHINRFLDYFPKKQMLFILFREYTSKPDEVLEEVGDFLGVSTFNFDDSSIKRNPSRKPLSHDFQKLIYKIGYRDMFYEDENMFKRGVRYLFKHIGERLNHLPRSKDFPELSPENRELLIQKYFIEDIKRLEKLIDRDLDFWKR